MTDSAWPTAASTNPPSRRSGPAHARLRYAPSDYVALLWRERWLMLWTFLVVLALGLAVAFFMKTTYAAQSSLLVRLSQEYVYQPVAGDAARGAVPEPDQILQSETEILSSAEVKERVLDRLGIAHVFPSIARNYDSATPDQRRMMVGKAVDAMTKSLKVATTPGAPVVRLSYDHTNPQMAALVLNTILDEYLIYRRSILLDPTQPLEDQRKAFE